MVHSFFSMKYNNSLENVLYWKGVFTSACPNIKHHTDEAHSEQKVVGITMAHLRMIRSFYNRHSAKSLDKHVLIIFEGDAVCGVPQCGDRAIEQIKGDYNL